MRVVNVPRAKDPRAQLTPDVTGETLRIVVIDPRTTPPFDKTAVCDLFIGDHMFDCDMRAALRMMVGHALVSAIEAGRDAGYRQAQADIRAALGLGER